MNNDFFSLSKPIYAVCGSLLLGVLYIILIEVTKMKFIDYEMGFVMVVGFIIGNIVRCKINKDKDGGVL